MTLANRAICEDTSGDQFVTLFFAGIDVEQRSLQYVAAGHPGFLVSNQGVVHWLDQPYIPLGIRRQEYESSEALSLRDQALFFTVTDGIWESMNRAGEPFGFKAIFAVVAAALGTQHSSAGYTAAQIVDQLFAAVEKHRLDSPTIYDSAVVLARFGSD